MRASDLFVCSSLSPKLATKQLLEVALNGERVYIVLEKTQDKTWTYTCCSVVGKG